MNEQDSITLCGVLMSSLAIGKCAVVFSQGQFIRTAPVVAILSRDAHAVQFATQHRTYTLLLDPLTQSARNMMPALAA